MLEELKYHLKITWNEEDSDLQRLLETGKQVIEEYTGTQIDFESDLTAQDLLLNWCRYSRNNATEFFQQNFSEDLTSLAFREAIKKQGETNE